ncbi:MAG TPA: OmpH family outer membrane protein [Rhizomicrobium sp.]|jgi:Skp family chaperone for outer membrane proteins|nr:OmpH family outer membrane protein [Rhizomicrobium sp.]
MKKTLILSLALAGLTSAGLATTAFADPPQPKIVVLDRAAIMQFSKAGQDIAKQMQAYSAQAKADLQGQGRALEVEERSLQQQVAILAPDVKAKKIAAFQAKQQGLQGQVAKKDEQMRYAFAQARAQMEAKLGPILQGLVKARGANMVLDKQAVVFATQGGFDITGEAINQLNQQLPSLKVNFNVTPPPAPKK